MRERVYVGAGRDIYSSAGCAGLKEGEREGGKGNGGKAKRAQSTTYHGRRFVLTRHLKRTR